MKLTGKPELLQRPVENPGPIWILTWGKSTANGLSSAVTNVVVCIPNTRHSQKLIGWNINKCMFRTSQRQHKLTVKLQRVQRPVELPLAVGVLPRGQRMCQCLGSAGSNAVPCSIAGPR